MLPAGIYRHYKGPLYLVIGTAHDANADSLFVEKERIGYDTLDEREVVVYIPLMLDGAHLGPRMAVRTRSDFEASCCVIKMCAHYGQNPDSHGQPRICFNDGHLWPRFEYLGEHLTQEMLLD